jgi:hypothetical protein
MDYLLFLPPSAAYSRPCRISPPNTYIMYTGNTSQAPLGIIHKNTKDRKSLWPILSKPAILSANYGCPGVLVQTGECLIQPIKHSLEERQACCAKGQQDRPCSHLPVNSSALAQSSQPSQSTQIWRTASLLLFLLPVRVDPVQVDHVGDGLECIKRALCGRPAIVRIPRLAPIYLIDLAIKLIRDPQWPL